MESISLLWDINSWGPVTRGFVFVIWAIAGAVLAFELFYLVKWMLAFRKSHFEPRNSRSASRMCKS